MGQDEKEELLILWNDTVPSNWIDNDWNDFTYDLVLPSAHFTMRKTDFIITRIPSIYSYYIDDLKMVKKDSAAPSDIPSEVPSYIPSVAPSTIPSVLPSQVPSLIPSTVPSVLPSHIPSTLPSNLPSGVPSSIP